MASLTHTENGDVTHSTSGNPLVDLFGQLGSARTWDPATVTDIWERAYAFDRLLALKFMFYLRDVRGGLGERKTFRHLLQHVESKHPEDLYANLDNVREYGRWDDLWCLLDRGSAAQSHVADAVASQLKQDAGSANPSLLAKWMPSENTSSPATRASAGMLRRALGMSSKEYRRALVDLRKKINIIENSLRTKDGTAVDVKKIPGRAMRKYRKAVTRNWPDKVQKWASQVEKGEITANAETLYPYDLVHAYLKNLHVPSFGPPDPVIEAQWKSLPDYLGPGMNNALAVVDVSGSMDTPISPKSTVTAMNVSVSLGIYLAERAKGRFHNHFITFSSSPQIEALRGDTLAEKCFNLAKANWSMSTDIDAVFEGILRIAVSESLPEDEMPGSILIISDMQFNAAVGNHNSTALNRFRSAYAAAGYKMPQLVFWNVMARPGQSAAKSHDLGVSLVSGFSPSIMKTCLGAQVVTPEKIMLETLNQPRYDKVVVC